MITKPFWESKTFWINLLAALGCVFVGWWFSAEQWATITAATLGVVNIILRVFFTSEGLSLTGPEADK